MHKVKNKLEVNCATTTPKYDESSTPDCISQDLSEDDDVLKKKWVMKSSKKCCMILSSLNRNSMTHVEDCRFVIMSY